MMKRAQYFSFKKISRLFITIFNLLRPGVHMWTSHFWLYRPQCSSLACETLLFTFENIKLPPIGGTTG